MDVAGCDVDGAPRRVALSAPGCWTLLVFLGPRCDACEPFWSASPTALGLRAGDRVALVLRPPADRRASDELRVRASAVAEPAQVVVSDDAWAAYGVLGAPFYVLVDGEAVVTEGVAWSLGQVGDDVARARSGDARDGR